MKRGRAFLALFLSYVALFNWTPVILSISLSYDGDKPGEGMRLVMKRTKIAVVTISILSILLIGQIEGVHQFVTGKTQTYEDNAISVFQSFDSIEDTELLAQIQKEAITKRIEPINAVVDSVWKAVPGYNGVEVDVQQTYNKTLKEGDPKNIQFVYREIEPEVKLEDLEAQPIYRGNSNKPMVALMINVAWGNEFIIPMLDTLDEAHVKATFFLDGSWLNKNEVIAKEIQKRGHQLENHAYSHPNMSQLNRERANLEISKTKQLLKDKLGVDNKWFAPPSGDFNQQTVNLAAEQGLKTVLWTLDTIDWKNPPPQNIINKVSKRVEAGTLILMHPTSSSKQALKEMIAVIQNKGLQLGTVAQTLSSNRVSIP